MNLRVQREEFTPNSTRGKLYIDGEFECYTLEPVWMESEDIKPRAIPQGTYQLAKRFSDKHGREVPAVENVPGFEDIEIHWGNFPRDTDGCLLVGQHEGPQLDFVGGSKLAFAALWEKLVPVWEGGEAVDITYVNIRNVPAVSE